jgi:hypothetical protein
LFCLGNALYIKIGDKEVEYNADFRFYITTKLSNPHYTPEISTKALIVNFAVKEQGIFWGVLLYLIFLKSIYHRSAETGKLQTFAVG